VLSCIDLWRLANGYIPERLLAAIVAMECIVKHGDAADPVQWSADGCINASWTMVIIRYACLCYGRRQTQTVPESSSSSDALRQGGSSWRLPARGRYEAVAGVEEMCFRLFSLSSCTLAAWRLKRVKP
jgi:hypothetical protein